MVKNITTVFFAITMFLGLLCMMPAHADAAELDWHTTKVYYPMTENGLSHTLVIEGYFQNNTDKYIKHINDITLTAYITGQNGELDTVKSTFGNFDKMMSPWGTSKHRFRIRRGSDKDIWAVAHWKVQRGHMSWQYGSAAG